MRTNKSPIEFMRAVAKKKPRYQELLNNVFKMSPSDIDALPEPLWVRQALHSCRDQDSRDVYVAGRLARVIQAEEEQAKQPKPTYEVWIWNGPTAFIGGNGCIANQWKIEVCTGDSFMIVDDVFIRFGDSVLKVLSADVDRKTLIGGSKMVGYMTLDNYRGFHRALLNQKHKVI